VSLVIFIKKECNFHRSLKFFHAKTNLYPPPPQICSKISKLESFSEIKINNPLLGCFDSLKREENISQRRITHYPTQKMFYLRNFLIPKAIPDKCVQKKRIKRVIKNQFPKNM